MKDLIRSPNPPVPKEPKRARVSVPLAGSEVVCEVLVVVVVLVATTSGVGVAVAVVVVDSVSSVILLTMVGELLTVTS